MTRGVLFEFLDSLAKPFGQFRQLPRAEQDEDQREDQNDLSAAQIKKTKESIHAIAAIIREAKRKQLECKGPIRSVGDELSESLIS